MDLRASPHTNNTPVVSASLRSSFKTDKPQLSNLRKAVLLTQSRKSIFKNRSEQTFESNQCLEDSKACVFEPSSMISGKISRQIGFNRHQKSKSAQYHPFDQRKSVNTEVSYAAKPLSILSKLAKQSKQSKQPRLTINELMKSKFRPCRTYQNSKQTVYNILPSFLSFSISKRVRCERAMECALRGGSFKQHLVYYENRFIFM